MASPATSDCEATGPSSRLRAISGQLKEYGLALGNGPRFEMYLYVTDLDGLIAQLRGLGMRVLRDPEDMPWGERIATVADTEGNPVALCAER